MHVIYFNANNQMLCCMSHHMGINQSLKLNCSKRRATLMPEKKQNEKTGPLGGCCGVCDRGGSVGSGVSKNLKLERSHNDRVVAGVDVDG